MSVATKVPGALEAVAAFGAQAIRKEIEKDRRRIARLESAVGPEAVRLSDSYDEAMGVKPRGDVGRTIEHLRERINQAADLLHAAGFRYKEDV